MGKKHPIEVRLPELTVEDRERLLAQRKELLKIRKNSGIIRLVTEGDLADLNDRLGDMVEEDPLP